MPKVSQPRINVILQRTLAAFLLAIPLAAQPQNPVHWTLTPQAEKVRPGSTVILRLNAKVDQGWHLYSMTTPKGGAPSTKIAVAENPAITFIKFHQQKPETRLDPNFGVQTESYEHQAEFLIEAAVAVNAASGPLDLTAQLRYSVCSETQCLPQRKSVATSLTIAAAAPKPEAFNVPAGYQTVDPLAAKRSASPVPATPAPDANRGLGSFLLLAFSLGLASIFTPCVFPMIPFTVGAFMDQKEGGWTRALVFCLGIIFMFTALGFGLTLLLGPFAVKNLSANPWVNGFTALIFLAFGLSLLGAFELTLPYALVNKMNAASGQGGYVGALLAGFTFTLTSFACVGPFMGTLLAASVGGDKLQPVMGMAAFASGLALPFFFLALFPGLLRKMPRSGDWLMRVKVVMGFIVLAWMLKYVSNIDSVLQLGLLPRDRFLALWVVLFALPGTYLLGWLPLEGISRKEKLSVTRLLLGAAFLAFAIGLIPGMLGSPLGDLDSMVPAAAQTAGSSKGGISLEFIKDDYPRALAEAKRQNKLLFLEFTGYACSNCKWMKANMFPKPEIQFALSKLVLVELYTDGSEPINDQNAKMQEARFNTVATPLYVIVDGDDKVLATFPGSTRDSSVFLKFLQTGQSVQ